MDELIVRVLRTVACVPRLRILSRLGGGEELTLSRLAGALHLRRDLVCTHLARLSAVGLVRRRRSGRRCFCIAGSPYGPGTVSGQVASWLGDALRSQGALPHQAHPPERRGKHATDGLQPIYGTLMDAATAFTHPRRIQILRRLASPRPAFTREFTRELRMSAPALNRHLAKLIRRGYVSAEGARGHLSYRLAPTAKTPQHAQLLEIVQEHWGEQAPSA
ncbi:MAG TPA: helix-turn-helix transcriptional regulator [Planctomycetota bacterium]|nr:helix-turn-helix transcriptional regulator [Planctomycetota bacterium]